MEDVCIGLIIINADSVAAISLKVCLVDGGGVTARWGGGLLPDRGVTAS